MPQKAILIKPTPQLCEGSIYVMNGSVSPAPNVMAVSSPKNTKMQQSVIIAAIKELLNFSGCYALDITGITIPIPS